MSRLQSDEELGKCLAFSNVSLKDKGGHSFYLVYSSHITVEGAIACAYQLGTADQMKDVALSLRNIIKKAFQSSVLPWPPIGD